MPLYHANKTMNPEELFQARKKVLIDEFNDSGMTHPVNSLPALFEEISGGKPSKDPVGYLEFLLKVMGG